VGRKENEIPTEKQEAYSEIQYMCREIRKKQSKTLESMKKQSKIQREKQKSVVYTDKSKKQREIEREAKKLYYIERIARNRGRCRDRMQEIE
jgi:N-acetylmuramoyl-L-alanine amidase CwlA